jgi:hypothetical protein
VLSLPLKSFWWAVWWPVGAWLLMGKKVASRRQAVFGRRQLKSGNRGQVRRQESIMTNDAFMKTEVPNSFRDLMKVNIEQAKRAFDTFAATSEKTWKTFETSSRTASRGLRSLNEKIAEITRSNAEANFALAMKGRRKQGCRPGHGAANRARAEADGDLRASARRDPRPRGPSDPGQHAIRHAGQRA